MGDTVVENQAVFESNGKSIADLALESGAEEIVVAMDDRRGNLPIRELLDARLKGIDVIDLLEFLERETGKAIVACNAALYWQALRACGINDSVPGHGHLLYEG